MNKYKVTKSNVDQESRLFDFLRVGSIIYMDMEGGRVYSEDKEQWVPLNSALQFGVDAEMIQ